MQVQDSYGSSQQITRVTKLWELKCLEYLYLQVHFCIAGFRIVEEYWGCNEIISQMYVFLKQYYFQILCN